MVPRALPHDVEGELAAFLDGGLELGSTVHTDGRRGYDGLECSGYAHVREVVDGSGLEAHVVLPSVHRVFSLLKRWMLGTHRGAISRKRLQRCPSEFEFRFNRRASRVPTHLFQRLMDGVARDGHRSYATLVGKVVSTGCV